jgi:hypothetical protein
MHPAFRAGFEKTAHDPHALGSDSQPQRKTKFDWKPTMIFAGAGALGGVADAMVSQRPSWGRGLALTGIGATMGALEGTRLGPDAPLSQKIMHTAPAAMLGGGTAWVMSHGANMKQRIAATALGAAASGLTSSL